MTDRSVFPSIAMLLHVLQTSFDGFLQIFDAEVDALVDVIDHLRCEAWHKTIPSKIHIYTTNDGTYGFRKVGKYPRNSLALLTSIVNSMACSR